MECARTSQTRTRKRNRSRRDDPALEVQQRQQQERESHVQKAHACDRHVGNGHVSVPLAHDGAHCDYNRHVLQAARAVRARAFRTDHHADWCVVVGDDLAHESARGSEACFGSDGHVAVHPAGEQAHPGHVTVRRHARGGHVEAHAGASRC